MKILLVDDERLSLLDLEATVREVLPEELDPEDFTGLEAAYRQEVKPENGSVIVTYGRDGDSHIVRILDKKDHSLHAEVVLQ